MRLIDTPGLHKNDIKLDHKNLYTEGRSFFGRVSLKPFGQSLTCYVVSQRAPMPVMSKMCRAKSSFFQRSKNI